MNQTAPVSRAVLAYSGGLDTSIIVHWLKHTYECEVVCYCSDVGQGAELTGLEERARRLGADAVVVEDLKLSFARDYCFPALRAGAVYEGRYLLGTALARPLIAARQVEWAERLGADAVAHGCTGKGNDQVRFELTYQALAPQLAVIAPWREWDITSREDALAYAEKHGLSVLQTATDLYSRDGNLWHLSHEGGPLEDPLCAPDERMFRLTAGADQHPATPERVTITFEAGHPVALDGRERDPAALLQALNERAARHGVGRVDLVESRLVGMKSRGVYETPAGTVLHEAIEDLCRLVLPHDVLRTRAELALKMADLIYNGLWFSPLRVALQAFVDRALQAATGDVVVELFHGTARAVGRTSPQTLYQPQLASFDMAGYDATHAEGFIRLFGLPLAMVARRSPRREQNGGSCAADSAPAVNALRNRVRPSVGAANDAATNRSVPTGKATTPGEGGAMASSRQARNTAPTPSPKEPSHAG